MIVIVDLGKRIRALRLGKNLTQEQLAKRIGMTKSVISAYEASMRYPSYDVLMKLASIFSVSIDFLLGVTHKQTIDISELSEENKALVVNFVEALKEKNTK